MKIKQCVGCGFCCLKAQCDASIRVYGYVKIPCPGLYWNQEKQMHRCKLMEIPGDLGFKYRKELAANEGCCCGLNTWRNDITNRIPNKKR